MCRFQHVRLLGGREFDVKKDGKARLRVTGELLHGLLRLPDAVEVLDTELQLRGDLFPVPIEGSEPELISEIPDWAAGSST